MRNSYLFILFIVLFAISACREGSETYSFGKIRLNIIDKVETRAMPDELTPALTDLFTVRMVCQEDDKLVFGGTCAEFNAEAQLFRSGLYHIKVFHGDNTLLAMDAPYYISDDKEITIESGKSQEVTLACKVGNSLASFVFENQDKLEKVLKSYYVEVVVKNERLRWTPGTSANPYFKAGSEVEFYLKGIWIENNMPYSRKFASILPVEAGKRYNYRLKFDTSNMTGAILDVQVETLVETIIVNQTLPADWLPKPKLMADGFDENNHLIYTETDDAQMAEITFTALRPIQDLELILNFADPRLSALNKSYLFSTMSEAEKVELQKANIILPVLDGVVTTGTLGFTSMTSSLLTKDDGGECDNLIKIRIKANNRWSDQVDYLIKTIKPIFNIGIFPGNVWTKELTVNSLVADSVKSGNFNRFKDISYEFSMDGTNWTVLPTNLRKEQLTPGTTYYVRPKYRGTVPGETTAVRTYEALDIPNSGLNDGYSESNPKKSNPLYAFNGGWIGTRNLLTCHGDGANAFYVSKSSTLPVSDNGSTVAHLMTIGWGAGNTCSFGKKSGSVINNISAGIVCVGDYKADQDSVHAKAAYIRPTSMSFVYKAAPYNGDEYEVMTYFVNLTETVETIIGQGYMKSGTVQGSYVTQKLEIVYDDLFKALPITHVRIVFKAGTKEDRDHLEDDFSKQGSGSFYSNYYLKGSQFWLDSFVLNYEK